jgi:DnaJ-class molecular chaperone
MSLSNYPPGVSGNEPQITGEYPCAHCGATLPEEAECEMCDGEGVVEGAGPDRVRCPACLGSGTGVFHGDTCPDGCQEPDWDDERDRREGF